ncbi:MAG TPA: DEAD/DEAH box helicase [Gemmatimonadaceae bacterium]|nr:DEAD/DEAH box helicase [Gemmatimonadaceae bacterium]
MRDPTLRLLYIIDPAAHPDPAGLRVDILRDPAAPPARHAPAESHRLVHPSEFDTVLPELCATGRCGVRLSASHPPTHPARWDEAGPWRLALIVSHADESGSQELTGTLTRAGETMPLSAPSVLHPSGILYSDAKLARFDHGGAFAIALALRHIPRVPLAEGELGELLELIYSLPHGPSISLPDDVAIGEAHAAPVPWLSIATDDSPWKDPTPVLTHGFQYGAGRIAATDPRDLVFDKSQLVRHHRDRAAEEAARERLLAAGARVSTESDPAAPRFTVARSKLGPLVLELLRDGWRVEASGKRYRANGTAHAQVRSGIDWFDLDLRIDYDGAYATLPALLDALRHRQATVTLSDGSVGLLPVEWLARFAPALAAGRSSATTTRFKLSQVGLLDALLAAMPDVSVDDTFERARARMHGFEGIAPVDPAPTFTGTLREYQREGLGWLHFLREFGLGGCLADDMGLGKTVQVLALLDALPREPERKPSIIVVPRSLVFNWMREAERFTPSLRMLDFTSARRSIVDIASGEIDVVITTYGTLRRDIAELGAIEFEYAILDEAQAIKNAGTASAKAARLLRARHRLALSGTPIENRLEELWSIFEFLNPGMLGVASTFGLMADLASDAAEDGGAGVRTMLKKALKPVILRRTKDQVTPELPERVEQTLLVDMEPAQRAFYMELLAATRRTVFDEIDRTGIGGARMHILEALLRLRQAACHPVLVDHSRPDLPSAKLDELVPSLEEIVEEGHKAVVFSQFTSFLTLVRRRLDAAGIRYEYLDGSTRDRGRRVDSFQSAEGPPVFLISLKAGGHGLNLTAADYVYLLDPWWNPAVEAQAIDRAHRIGQTRRVIATRLVARGTIEEKVLELQNSKRALADAILGGEQGGLAGIGREELEALLAG